jgi:hypothetical protein
MESAICKSEPNEPDGKHLNSSDDPVTGGRYDRVGESWGGVVGGSRGLPFMFRTRLFWLTHVLLYRLF